MDVHGKCVKNNKDNFECKKQYKQYKKCLLKKSKHPSECKKRYEQYKKCLLKYSQKNKISGFLEKSCLLTI